MNYQKTPWDLMQIFIKHMLTSAHSFLPSSEEYEQEIQTILQHVLKCFLLNMDNEAKNHSNR